MSRISRAAGILLLLPTLAACASVMRAAPTQVAAQVRSQIEAIEGKLKQLRSEISMSELDIHVRRPWLF